MKLLNNVMTIHIIKWLLIVLLQDLSAKFAKPAK
jgi:hypothetical protein